MSKPIIKSVKEQKMEIALNELKIETRRFNRKDGFASSFAKYYKMIEKARFRAEIKAMKKAIKEEKKKLKRK
jgi:hypothetical protein